VLTHSIHYTLGTRPLASSLKYNILTRVWLAYGCGHLFTLDQRQAQTDPLGQSKQPSGNRARRRALQCSRTVLDLLSARGLWPLTSSKSNTKPWDSSAYGRL